MGGLQYNGASVIVDSNSAVFIMFERANCWRPNISDFKLVDQVAIITAADMIAGEAIAARAWFRTDRFWN